MTDTLLDRDPPVRTPHPLAVGGAVRGIVRPWLFAAVIAAALGAFDNVISHRPTNAAYDLGVNLLAAAGLILAARASVLAVRRGETPRYRIPLRGAVYGAGFIGPMLATVMLTWASRDIDGSSWMLFSPVMGVFLVAVGLLLGRRLR